MVWDDKEKGLSMLSSNFSYQKIISKVTRYLLAVIVAFSVSTVWAQNDFIMRFGEFEGGGGPGASTGIADINSLAWENVSERLSTYDFNLMGDQIDHATGSLVFSQTDVSIPGNSGLEVAIRRRAAGQNLQTESAGFFGDWQLDIPNISMLTPKYASGHGGSLYSWPNRCTSDTPPETNPSGGWLLEEYWSGMDIHIPGMGTQKILDNPDTTVFGSHSPNKATTSHLLFKCISNIGYSNGGGQGYLVTTPNGTTYKFDVLSYLNAQEAKKGSLRLQRRKAVLFVSEITDKNGNWVRYTYNSAKRPTHITSNDGRTISIYYNYLGYVSSVTANGRSWTYTYGAASGIDIDNSHTLTRVTRPDGKYWSFNFANWRNGTMPGHCTRGSHTISMTHPHGAQGQFTFAETRFGRTGVPYILKTNQEIEGLFGCNEEYIYVVMPWSESMALTSKVISGSSIATSTWSFAYPPFDDGNFSSSDGSNPEDLRKTTVTDPAGLKTEYFHNRHWSARNGQLEKVIQYAANGSVMRETKNTYVIKDDIFGSIYRPLALIDTATMKSKSYATRSVVKQDGDTFTTESVYNTNHNSSSYSYGKPLSTSSHSNVNTSPRTTVLTYEHKKTPWILGLPKTQTTNNRLEQELTYDSKGRATQVKEYGYGTPVARYGYNSDGTVSWFKDANNRTTYVSNYHRGLARTKTRPDGVSESRAVNNDGWVTQITDANGNSTGYQYDSMGRLTRISPPGSWDDSNISYNFNGGGVVQTITTGQSSEVINYDAMFRPVLERTRALDTGWSSYVNTDYNSSGQMTFKSQPSSSANETKGKDFTYDGLGRITSEKENVSPYAETKHRYPGWHRHRIYDPANNITDYYSYGYDGPGSKDYRAIYEYQGSSWRRKTFIAKNVWGELYRLTQNGRNNGYNTSLHQYFYYNSRRQLCRHYAPEHGATKYAYDAAGQMTAYSKGQSNSGCTVPNNSSRVTMNYDALGRLKTTAFSDSPNITRSYDNNGNLKTINRGGANWSYGYNSLNALTYERLDIDGRNFDLAYQYNNAGHMTRTTLPSGRHIDYTTDGLGRMRTIKKGSGNVAYNINYHTSGAVSGMTYGNGQQFTQTLNNRLLPYQMRSVKGSQKALDQTFSYDSRGNISSILDGAVSGNNRTYSYDGLGQLTAAYGPWGNSSYIYDGVGNLRKKTLGSRTVNLVYNSVNRMTNSVDTGSVGNRSFLYDTRGNITATGNLTFTYDRSDQPTAMNGTANGIGSISSTYKYDGNLKRVKSVVNGATIYNVYDQSGALVHVDIVDGSNSAHDKTVDYVKGPMGTLARISDGGAFTYLHPDHLGSAQSGTNSSGNVAWRERYTPFGESLVDDSANDNLAGYTGHIKDKASGLNYMQARYYDPTIGRFLSVDPKTFQDTGHTGMFNRYSYTYNNPVGLVDPDGEHPVLIVIAVKVIMARAAVGATMGAASGGLSAHAAGGSILKGMGKGAVVGGVSGATLSPAAAGATAGVLGFGDGVASSNSESLRGKVKDGALQAGFEAGTTFIGGTAGGNLGKSFAQNEAAGNAAGTVVSAAINESVDALVSGSLGEAVNGAAEFLNNKKQEFDQAVDEHYDQLDGN